MSYNKQIVSQRSHSLKGYIIGGFMYLLFQEDGSVDEVEVLPDTVSWCTWPTVVKIALYAGPDYTAFKLVKDGWEEIKERPST